MDMNIETLREIGLGFFGDLGAWVYDCWEEHNTTYFEGKLVPGPILWGITPHGRGLGYHQGSRNLIYLHTSLINPSSEDPWKIGSLLGKRFADDVLLHEMIHQYINQFENYTGRFTHNCDPWCDQIVRLSKIMGMDIKAKPLKQKRIREEGQKGPGKVTWIVEPGHLTRKEISSWPHSIRPASYYEKDVQSLL